MCWPAERGIDVSVFEELPPEVRDDSAFEHQVMVIHELPAAATVDGDCGYDIFEKRRL